MIAAALFPPLEPFRTHRLAVGDGHELKVEECGRADGEPVLFLHGGPGSGCAPWHRQFFDPERYRAVLPDQRGAGASTRPDHTRAYELSHLVKDLRRSYETGEGETGHVVPLFAVEVLLIDELGRGQRTEWELTVLDDLISRRYNAGKITLCTTNFSIGGDRGAAVRKVLNAAHEARKARSATAHATQSLQDRMDERIFSRLSEMCEFVEVDGEDYRRRQ